MKKLILLCFAFILVACQEETVHNSAHITEEEIVLVLKEHDVELKKIKRLKDNIYASKLNGEKPGAYELDGKDFLIYEFQSSDDVTKALKEFDKKTEGMDIVSSNTYEKRNVLIFYVHLQNRSKPIPYHQAIEQALASLIEG